MNPSEVLRQAYRALHMPPARLLKKLTGSKEIYTIAVRRRDPEHPLPVLGEGAYTPLPFDPDTWYADPLLCRWQGKRVLFCEAFDMAAGKGRIAVFDFDEDGHPVAPRTAVEEPYHLSFPATFVWNRVLYMIPESGANHSVNLYRCKKFPGEWVKTAEFPVGRELCDAIVWAKGKTGVSLLFSETRPENQLYTRYCRYTLRQAETGYALDPDDAYNAAHLDFDLASRNAGPLFAWCGQAIHPTQVSTTVDYGVYLQFFSLHPDGERPLCAAEPPRVEITGLPAADIIGIHSYCCDEELEIIDARYLRKLPVPPAEKAPTGEEPAPTPLTPPTAPITQEDTPEPPAPDAPEEKPAVPAEKPEEKTTGPIAPAPDAPPATAKKTHRAPAKKSHRAPAKRAEKPSTSAPKAAPTSPPKHEQGEP